MEEQENTVGKPGRCGGREDWKKSCKCREMEKEAAGKETLGREMGERVVRKSRKLKVRAQVEMWDGVERLETAGLGGGSGGRAGEVREEAF